MQRGRNCTFSGLLSPVSSGTGTHVLAFGRRPAAEAVWGVHGRLRAIRTLLATVLLDNADPESTSERENSDLGFQHHHPSCWSRFGESKSGNSHFEFFFKEERLKTLVLCPSILCVWRQIEAVSSRG